MDVFLATQNQGKVKEYQSLLKSSSLKLLKLPKILIFKETGLTFRENALIKAETYGRFLNAPVLADDSGLMIEALNGFPGVKTNRFAKGNYPLAMEKIINKLKNQPNRRAKFICCLAFYLSGQPTKTFQGEINGLINDRPLGKSGFGFDPIFYYPPLRKTFAQMTLAEKNLYSHRAKALAKFLKWLELSETRR